MKRKLLKEDPDSAQYDEVVYDWGNPENLTIGIGAVTGDLYWTWGSNHYYLAKKTKEEDLYNYPNFSISGRSWITPDGIILISLWEQLDKIDDKILKKIISLCKEKWASVGKKIKDVLIQGDGFAIDEWTTPDNIQPQKKLDDKTRERIKELQKQLHTATPEIKAQIRAEISRLYGEKENQIIPKNIYNNIKGDQTVAEFNYKRTIGDSFEHRLSGKIDFKTILENTVADALGDFAEHGGGVSSDFYAPNDTRIPYLVYHGVMSRNGLKKPKKKKKKNRRKK